MEKKYIVEFPELKEIFENLIERYQEEKFLSQFSLNENDNIEALQAKKKKLEDSKKPNPDRKESITKFNSNVQAKIDKITKQIESLNNQSNNTIAPTGPGPTGPGPTGPGPTGPGPTGPGVTGATSSGTGPTGPGVTGATSSGTGPTGPKSSEKELDDATKDEIKKIEEEIKKLEDRYERIKEQAQEVANSAYDEAKRAAGGNGPLNSLLAKLKSQNKLNYSERILKMLKNPDQIKEVEKQMKKDQENANKIEKALDNAEQEAEAESENNEELADAIQTNKETTGPTGPGVTGPTGTGTGPGTTGATSPNLTTSTEENGTGPTGPTSSNLTTNTELTPEEKEKKKQELDLQITAQQEKIKEIKAAAQKFKDEGNEEKYEEVMKNVKAVEDAIEQLKTEKDKLTNENLQKNELWAINWLIEDLLNNIRYSI